MLNLTRRTFITSGVIISSAAAVGTGMVVNTLVGSGPFRAYVKNIIKRRLPYLNIEPQILEQFAADLETAWAPNPKQRMAAFAGGFGASMVKMFQPNRVDWFERRVATTLLKASDFFETGAHQGHKLTYYGIRDDGCSALSYLLEVDQGTSQT
ncbi:MAG: hypothetical protein AAFZ74_04695 [Pseudomonadota bacterium]